MRGRTTHIYSIEELDDRVEFFFWGFMDFLKSWTSNFSDWYNEFTNYLKTTVPKIYDHLKGWMHAMKSYFEPGSC